MALSRQLFSAWCDSRGLDIKSHQLDGFEWVMNRETGQGQGFSGAPGGFICDEMGLGKTILMIGALVLNPKAHNLVVLPKSLLDQWCEAITKFTAF